MMNVSNLVMNNRDQSNIDELFREGLTSGNETDTFPEENWRKLTKRLDRHDQWMIIGPWLKPFLSAAAVILLVLLLWPEQEQKTAVPQEQKQHAQEQAEGAAKPALPPDEREQERKPAEPLASEPSETYAAARPQKETIVAEPAGKQDKTERKSPAALAAKSETKEKKSSAAPAGRGQGESPERKTGAVSDTVQTVKPPAPKESRPQMAGPQRHLPAETVHRDRPELSVALLVAPSYNGVDQLNKLQPGADAGILFTLGINRWSLSTGAVYAKKLYDASYDSSYGFQQVDADCRVLDIPLNISYAFIQNAKSSFSLGTGISSYLMLREDYRYLNSDREDLHLVNENQHWFSVLNLQATYARRLNSRLSINVQPFAKIPVSDIGQYKVRLQSYGMALGVSWNF